MSCNTSVLIPYLLSVFICIDEHLLGLLHAMPFTQQWHRLGVTCCHEWLICMHSCCMIILDVQMHKGECVVGDHEAEVLVISKST